MDSDNPNEKSDDLPKSSASENVDASQSKDMEGENLEISNKNSYENEKRSENFGESALDGSDSADGKNDANISKSQVAKTSGSDDAEKNNVLKMVVVIGFVAVIATVLMSILDFYGIFSEEVDAPPKFVGTWNTVLISDGSSDYNQISLPLRYNGNYDFKVDWGDGSIDQIDHRWQGRLFDDLSSLSMQQHHTYENPGIYTITITGVIQGFAFDNKGDRNKLINITSWGPLNLGNSGGYFYGAENLETITAIDVNLSGTTNMAQMFRGASKFNGDVGGWDVGNVKSMAGMFYGAVSFDQDIGGWDVGQVTNMDSMFRGTSKFNGDVGGWDVGNVKSMAGMFSGAHNFNQDIGGWDVGNVKNMAGMFSGAQNLRHQSIGLGWYSAVEVSGAHNFNQDIGGWDVGNVVTMAGMFSGAHNFNQDIGGWDVGRVYKMDSMFRDTEDFNQDLSNWNVCNVAYYSKFDHNSSNWDDHFKPSFGSKCISPN